MEKNSFVKMSGAGNDFILFDKNVNSNIQLNKIIIKDLCDRRNGIGADGIIVISNSDDHDFVMDYFNADGSTGSLCGNGARCAIKFAEVSGRLKNGNTNFISNDESYSGEIIDTNTVKFYLNSPKKFKFNFKIKAGEQLINTNYVDTGSPHVIIKVEDVLKNPSDPKNYYTDLYDFPVFDLGKEIRYHKDFFPEGTNVNFIQIKEGKVLIRTYERGVEDETLACGTGSAAAALVGYLNYNVNPPITLITKGGEELVVDFKVKDKRVKDLSLTGSVKIIFTGEILLNKFF